MSAHEDLSRSEGVKASSDRAFGFVFTAMFAFAGLAPLMRGGSPRVWAFGLSASFLLTALFAPSLLKPLNWLWLQLAILLHKIMTPIVTGVMFFLVFTPLGWLMRMSGKDPLKMAYDAKADSYWITRTPPGPPPDSMINQF